MIDELFLKYYLDAKNLTITNEKGMSPKEAEQLLDCISTIWGIANKHSNEELYEIAEDLNNKLTEFIYS